LPVLFASPFELAQIIAIHARRLGILLDGDLIAALTDYTSGGGVLSGRSAVHLLDAAHVRALRAGAQTVAPQHVKAALDDWIGNDWTPAAEYSILSSLLTARHTDAWPWVAAAKLGERYEIPAYLAPYCTSTGQIDVGKMHERAAEHGRGLEFGQD